jgi:hypothetical protein
LDRLDQELVDEINSLRRHPSRIESRVEARKRIAKHIIGTKPPLADELAPAFPRLGSRENLRSEIERLGYTVTRFNENFVSVRFAAGKAAAKKKTRRYNIDDLFLEIELAYERLLARKRSGIQ